MSFSREQELIEVSEERDSAMKAADRVALCLAFSLAAHLVTGLYALSKMDVPEDCVVEIKGPQI